jgi:hypothetical protein
VGRVNVANPIIKVYLNGVEQQQVVAFNTKEGWVEKYAVTDAGLVVVDGELVTERFEGAVQAEGSIS